MKRIKPSMSVFLVAGFTVAGAFALPSCASKTKSAATATSVPTEATAATTTVASTTPVPSGPPDPCTLVTTDQVSRLVQLQMPEGTNVGQGDDLLCQFVSPPDGPTAQVEIYSGGGAHKSFQIDHDTLGHDFTQLNGVGDEAWLEDDNVFIRKGDTWVQVRVTALDVSEEDIHSRLTELAPSIVAKL